MKISATNKILGVLSLIAISAICVFDSASAAPAVHYGKKGTYTINDDGSYRGCLHKGGCITISSKYRVKRMSKEEEGIQWKKGEYVYSMSEGYIWVTKNGKVIFEDDALSR